MKISLITPAHKKSSGGNRTTAVRWAGLFRKIGHRVSVATDYRGETADLMVALHAWRSARSIERFHERFPDRPLVVALTGTDIYRFLDSHRATTLRSMETADALVCLHALVHEAIPRRVRRKLHVIYQSARPLPRRLPPSSRYFEVCVIANLRKEKDPLRAAFAVRDLPNRSRVRVTQFGRAHDNRWAEAARAEMARNERYRWYREVPGWRVRRHLAKTRAVVLSSIMEGGANVVSEAVVAGVPVIASEIHGTIGLLGREYPGYFPAEDTEALTLLLRRAEAEPAFLRTLQQACAARRHLFSPERETADWKSLIDTLR